MLEKSLPGTKHFERHLEKNPLELWSVIKIGWFYDSDTIEVMSKTKQGYIAMCLWMKRILASCLTVSSGCLLNSLWLFKESLSSVALSYSMIYRAITPTKNLRKARASGPMILGKLSSQVWMFIFTSWRMCFVLGQKVQSSIGSLTYILNRIKAKS